MGLLETIFPKKTQPRLNTEQYFKAFTAYAPVFTSYNGSLYEMELVRAAVHTHATHSAKLKPVVIGKASPALKNVIAYKPNPFMTTYQFLYRIRTILEMENTAFIVPLYGGKYGETITGFYPICPSRCEVVESNGVAYIRYHFSNGQTAAIEFDRCGIMTKMQYKNDFFGEDNNALRPTADLIKSVNDGIREGVKSSASIRFMGKLTNTFKPKDLDEQRRNFREANLAADNNGGIVLVDNRYSDLKQIESKPYSVDPKQTELIQNNVFDYFGINETVIQNKFTEEQWNAYYEGAVEPFATQLSMVITSMVYSAREIACGNEILFTANRLQYASNATKLNVVTQLFDRGMMTQNQGLEIFNMAPVEGGDKYFIRREYAEISKLDEDAADVIENEPVEEPEEKPAYPETDGEETNNDQ